MRYFLRPKISVKYIKIFSHIVVSQVIFIWRNSMCLVINHLRSNHNKDYKGREEEKKC